MKEIRVYIASPYSKDWMPKNIKRQFDAANKLMGLGYWPYVPLLTHFLELYIHREESKWLELDFVYLKTCDALLRLKPVDDKGIEIPSKGADLEEKLAIKENIPVFYSIPELNVHFKSDPEFYYKQGKFPTYNL
jgi:hypothetical protein